MYPKGCFPTANNSCSEEPNIPNNIESQEKKRFLSYFRDSKIPHPDDWLGQSPLFVSGSSRAEYINYEIPENIHGEQASLPLDGSVVPFSGPLFRGKIVSRIRDIPIIAATASAEHLLVSRNADYFKGRSRQFQWTVQGIFTKRMRFDELVTGQDFGRPFRNTPSSAVVKKGIHHLKNRLPETFECDLYGLRPRFEHSLVGGCQYFRVDRAESLIGVAGLVGEMDRGDIIEDTNLLGDSVPRSSEGRRKFFSKKKNLEQYFFEPYFLYSFEFYADFFSPSCHKLTIAPFFFIDLVPYFNGYPLFMAMARDKTTGKYLWATEMWHKRIIEYDTKSRGFIQRFLKQM